MLNTRASAKDDKCVAENRLALAQECGRSGAGHDGFNVKETAFQQCFVERPAIFGKLRLCLFRSRYHDRQPEFRGPRSMSQLQRLGSCFKCCPVEGQAWRVWRGPIGPRFSSQAHHDSATCGHDRLYKVADDFMCTEDESWVC